MNGYVRNMSPVWAHALKREIGPGKEIPLDELYNDYGKKHGLSEGEEFVGWLRSIKLQNREKWQIVFVSEEEKTVKEDDVSPEVSSKIEEKSEPKELPRSPLVPKTMEVSDVVSLSVRNAREVVPNIRDINLLRYALSEARQLANKDSLCKILRKRIQEIQISR
jgi:hypothetical protein